LRDVDVHGRRRRNAARGGTSSLQALGLVQRPVEAPFYGGLVARELGEGVQLGEGVRAAGVPYKGQTERRRIVDASGPSHPVARLVALSGEYADFRPPEPAWSSTEGGSPVRENIPPARLRVAVRLSGTRRAAAEPLSSSRTKGRPDVFFEKRPREGDEADSGFSLRRPRPGAREGVAAVCPRLPGAAR
jgi:hypothetical protein